MNRFRWIGLFGVVVWLAVGCANGEDGGEKHSKEETVVIPLSEIWALNMPGTRDIVKLQTEKLSIGGNGWLIPQIRRSLAKTPPQGKEGKPGFVVVGTGLEALREAHAVLVEEKKPQETFQSDSEISVVFFSHQWGSYVHLHKVARQYGEIVISYYFVPHEEMVVTEHLALIPLGKQSVGKHRVSIARSPMEQRLIDLGFQDVRNVDARRIVCIPFSFSVLEQGR